MSSKSSDTSLYETKIFGAELSGNAPQIDLHGMDTRGGIHELDAFLNQQFMLGEEVVKVIHGRGTGKLRDSVRAYLGTVPFVETFRDGQNPTEISGVTYVVLQKRE